MVRRNAVTCANESGAGSSEPPKGKQKFATTAGFDRERRIFRPLWGFCVLCASEPTAHAVGYILTPLRGCGGLCAKAPACEGATSEGEDPACIETVPSV